MTVFACAACGAALTASVSRVVLPDHAGQSWGYGLLGVLMESGTYAVDPQPHGPPWRSWVEVGVDEAEARGWYAPVFCVPFGPVGCVALAPGDLRGTEFIPGRVEGSCCGLSGWAGANLACAGCGRPVATRVDDCGEWQAVWLEPQAVAEVPGSTGPPQMVGWTELRSERPGVSPIEPPGHWSPLWAAAVAVALARLLVASAGTRVIVPDGPIADTFRVALDALLPSGPAGKTLALAGPGLPVVAADIALVPQHPQTGEPWNATNAVPLAWDIWAYLAFHHDRRPVPGAGAMPEDARRDDPLPLLPFGGFRPDGPVFLATLARLPEVRQPWLHDIYHVRRDHPHAPPF